MLPYGVGGVGAVLPLEAVDVVAVVPAVVVVRRQLAVIVQLPGHAPPRIQEDFAIAAREPPHGHVWIAVHQVRMVDRRRIDAAVVILVPRGDPPVLHPGTAQFGGGGGRRGVGAGGWWGPSAIPPVRHRGGGRGDGRRTRPTAVVGGMGGGRREGIGSWPEVHARDGGGGGASGHEGHGPADDERCRRHRRRRRKIAPRKAR